ncbi:uncharacterized protein LOC117823228 isoform X2 [Xyrichtys novacula]|uniref:Uncharacterized protein LOC117823228 isoform X2 n=1 Tax=Xyrichtys novacula TaxID=13765 RepID=A0AAV1FNU8_XYRNO|nr:uncharacterized protein LOC117823228 isoform X2 [Xyrichtys novacula]
MSVTVVKDKGVTMITVVSDVKSMLPPLCQILKALCYSPRCCSVRPGMLQTGVTAALGTVQILVGLFNLGLGPGRTSQHPRDFADLGVAYWLGGVFLVTGLVTVLAGQFPFVCLVGFTVFMNLLASLSSTIGIVMYSMDLGEVISDDYCWDVEDKDSCIYMEFFYKRMLKAMDITMLILTVLLLSVSISLSVLAIRALCRKTEKAPRGCVNAD